ncbi:helix-turn-helix domain-containing protein [Corynebacterium rouxii]|uniref:Helix-turn-helix domain-containing protein n=1 Tax=Corynebacterium rouxii TaxID=2719119 RepID=A0ABU3PJV6_9CORY|nr:helix-turn-helix domain-containing protein [Corynebacterium rouxii]MDT9407879.1 helix-turn-helix domain-containing protein [Corynebacterium rouxii]MDT9410061.1 helix-turn-helix domain-containing protein [Corynebacterium rouxii]
MKITVPDHVFEPSEEVRAFIVSAVADAIKELGAPTVREWMTVYEAADYMRVSRYTVAELAEKGRIQSTYVGTRSRRYNRRSIDAYLAKNATGKAVR